MKKKILIRIGSLYGGGAERVLINYLRHLDYSKYEVDLLLNIKYGVHLKSLPNEVSLFSITQYFNDAPIPLSYIGKAWNLLKLNFYRNFPKALYRSLLKNKKYDIEVAFLQTLGYDISKSPNKESKKICFVHTDMVNFKKYYPKSIKKTIIGLKKADQIICVSNASKESLIRLDSTIITQTKVIHNPIDIKEVISKSKAFKVRNNHEKVKIVTMGRLQEQKAFDRLIRIAHKLNKDNVFNFKIEIFGDGKLKNELQEMINTFKVNDFVELKGFVDNPFPYIKHADVFILPSINEGLPTVICEALILKTCILTTNVTGVNELTKNGELAYVVENNETMLYIKLKEILETPSLLEKHKNLINQSEFPFQINEAVKKFEAILDS